MEKKWKYLLLFISNVFFFFLCSTKWNAGYSISAGLAVLVIVWGRFQLNKKVSFFPTCCIVAYFLFIGGVSLASYLSGDPASMRVAYKFLAYSIPMWVLFFLLQRDISILPAIQWGIVAGTNVLNTVVIQEIWKVHAIKRIYGPFASPNHLAMVMESILPFLLLNTVYLIKNVHRESPAREKVLTVLSIVTSVLAVGAILLTRSRGGIAGFLLGAVFAFCALFLNHTHLSGLKKISALALVFVLSGAVVFGVTVNYLNRKYDPERVLLLTSAYHMWQDHPLYGVGIGRWNEVYRAHYMLKGAREPKLSLPHNNIANFFSGAGVLGGGGFVLFMLSVLYVLLRALRTQPDNHYIYAMLWVWIAISVHGMVDNSFFGRYNDRLLFAMLGVALAAIRQGETRLLKP